MTKRLIRLFGGHRNSVYKTNSFVKVIWKDGFKRKQQIREGVLTENFVASHTDILSRMLVDKSKPVQAENGELVTYFRYAEGEIRYPWNLDEIASAAKLLGRLHQAFPKVRPWHPPAGEAGMPRSDLNRQLHLDFARGNILFHPKASTAIGVIDFETTSKGPVEQELGRTLSFILVDTPTPSSFGLRPSAFASRRDALLTNYPLPFRKDKVINWTLRYLTGEDYGDLNFIRNQAVSWLRDSNLTM